MKYLKLFFSRIGLAGRQRRAESVSPVDGIVRLFRSMPGRRGGFGDSMQRRVR